MCQASPCRPDPLFWPGRRRTQAGRTGTARHGADAILVWRERRAEIDRVLSDVRMPEMGGPELVARLRAEAPGLPELFMSGYAAREAKGGGPLGPEGIRDVLDSAPGRPSTRARNHRDR